MFEVILFDLDNTLYDYDYTHNIALNSVFLYIKEKNDIDIDNLEKEYNIIKVQLKNDILKTGSCHSRIIYFKNLIINLYLKNIDAIELDDLYWKSFYNNMKLYNNISELLILFKKNNIKLGLITNFTTKHQLQKLKFLNIYHYFDHILTSEEVLMEKPNSLLFLTILNKFNCLSQNALMIGDSYDEDIVPALKLGINAIHISKEKIKNNNYIALENTTKLYHFFNDIFTKLKIFTDLSRKIGERYDLTQAGGGNVSFKYGDLLFIKSSGQQISDINLMNGYSIIHNDLLKRDILNNDYKNLQAYCILKKNKPSIETYMHSFLKQYTIHIHPIQVNYHLVQQDISKFKFKEIFSDSLFIDYITPGKDLAMKILNNYNNENIIFLKNHGIIITTDNFLDIIPTIDNIISKCDLTMNKYKYVNNISDIMEKIYNKPFFTLLVEDESIVKYLYNKPSISLFPDKVAYCGHHFFHLEHLTENNLRLLINNSKEIPKIILYENNIYITSKNIKKCKEIESVLKSHILIINQENNLELLTNNEIHFLLHWEDEIFRTQ